MGLNRTAIILLILAVGYLAGAKFPQIAQRIGIA